MLKRQDLPVSKIPRLSSSLRVEVSRNETKEDIFSPEISKDYSKVKKTFPKLKALHRDTPRHQSLRSSRILSNRPSHVPVNPKYVTPQLSRKHPTLKQILERYPFLNIKLEDFRMIRPLGEGGYGKVYLAEHIKAETLFALKFINMQSVLETKILRTVKHQIQIGSRPFRNDNVLQLRSFFFQKNYLVIIMEFCPMGDLFHYMNHCKGYRLESEEAKYVVWSVTNALKYMHSKHIMHRDLKPENILLELNLWRDKAPYTQVNKNLLWQTCLELEKKYEQAQEKGVGKFKNFMRQIRQRVLSFLPGGCKSPRLNTTDMKVKREFIERLTYLEYPRKKYIVPKNFVPEVTPKIADFGWSTHTHRGKKNTQCGTIYYMAPEVITSREYSFTVDVWAVGVLAYEITTGELPFDGNGEKDILNKIKSQQLQPTHKMSRECWNFIKSILNPPCDKRPTIEDVLNHPWLLSIKKLMRAENEKKKMIFETPPPQSNQNSLKKKEIPKKNFVKVNKNRFRVIDKKEVFSPASELNSMTPKKQRPYNEKKPWRF